MRSDKRFNVLACMTTELCVSVDRIFSVEFTANISAQNVWEKSKKREKSQSMHVKLQIKCFHVLYIMHCIHCALANCHSVRHSLKFS